MRSLLGVVVALSLPVMVLLYCWRAHIARVAAVLSVIAILAAPLILPTLGRLPAVLATAMPIATMPSSAPNFLRLILTRPPPIWWVDWLSILLLRRQSAQFDCC